MKLTIPVSGVENAFTERGRLMLKFSDAILGKIDELTELEALDTGKPLQVARADIIALARYFGVLWGAADKLHGETIPLSQRLYGFRNPRTFCVTDISCLGIIQRRCLEEPRAPSLAVGKRHCSRQLKMPAPALFLAELASERGSRAGDQCHHWQRSPVWGCAYCPS